ncbi:bacterioferritin [Paenibacillus anaericanus]|uniref:DUF2383 domain-containing protein n=1 Tax=Paenibacillus anaericanus TaxID=170367 RepID=UPI00277D3083|nr:DUF2383 domain-containing protein [Paenibacillus anaericanus]MDQ0090396.1 bacterioferritin [Paenibacillus anaericanus]
MDNSQVVKELNTFLEGNYMAILSYERYIQHVADPDVKKVLQDIQQEHKQHAIKVAERIQNLGGVPADDAGIQGGMVEFMNRFKKATDDPNFILQDALKGEEKGIQISEKMVRGDLDPESLTLVKEILNEDRNHLDQLNHHVH